MKLCTLLKNIPGLRVMGESETAIGGVAYDSRKVDEGSLFVALKGAKHDGADFLVEAVRNGATAVMLAEGGTSEAERICTENSVCLIISSEPRRDMALVAARLHGHPTKKIRLVGVTGTNGKTTTTYIAESIFKAAGKNTGVVGTINYRNACSETAAGQTTPEAADLQQMFSEMVNNGTEFCLLEVSSHALEMHRVWGSRFETALFTNLSQDHLDFHGDMENYFKVKRKLFRDYAVGTAIFNIDDPWGVKLWKDFRGRALTYGLAMGADFRAVDPRISMGGLKFTLMGPGGAASIDSPLLGGHNVYNILAAAAIAAASGIDTRYIQEGVEALDAVPGRFQRIDEGQSFSVIVDYAHTEDALRKLLISAGKLCRGRLIVLFGCGGDRDRGKRPLMGRAVAELSDLAVITSDNPRSEDPLSIIKEIEEGFNEVGAGGDNKSTDYMVVPDRREAIRLAVSAAAEGDLVVIAGKGHERYQVVGETIFPFDDVEEARTAINETAA